MSDDDSQMHQLLDTAGQNWRTNRPARTSDDVERMLSTATQSRRSSRVVLTAIGCAVAAAVTASALIVASLGGQRESQASSGRVVGNLESKPSTRSSTLPPLATVPRTGLLAPAASGTSSGASAAATSGMPCTNKSVSALGTSAGQGTAGEVQITVYLTNTGKAPCELNGPPALALLSVNGTALKVQPVPLKDQTLTAANLAPGRNVRLVVDWSNWCGSPPQGIRIAVTPTQDADAIIGQLTGPVPGCVTKLQPSLIMVITAYATS